MLKRYASLILAISATVMLSVAAVLSAPAFAGNLLKPLAKPFSWTPSGFGFASFEGSLGGTQAGSHPSALTVALEFNNREFNTIGGYARDITVNLPPGVVGNPNAIPQCPRRFYDNNECPNETLIGTVAPRIGSVSFEFNLYNLVPPPGVPAQFGFEIFGIRVFLDAGVRTGGDNGITERADNNPQRDIVYANITVQGVVDGKAFLTLPTSCGYPLKVGAEANTWEEPDAFATAPSFEAPAMTGCERLSFSPSTTIAPDTSVADSPTGLSVDVRVPQEEGLTNPERLVASNIQQTKVTLPAGVAVDPGRASGLQACQPSQEGLEPLPGGEEDEGPPSCPPQSLIGSVEVQTPLLRDALKGGVYVLQSNPPNLKLLLAPSGDGVNLKLVGEVQLNEATGQLTTTFSKTPDLPFTDLRMSLEGGPRGALVTPAACGSYTTSTDFTPWASPYVQDAFSENTFSVQSGPEGTSCGGVQPFEPSMVAGTASNQAGGFSPLSVTLSRRDRDQGLGGVTVQTPPGLLGLLKSAEECGEPQASVGECGAGSLIGHTTVALGPGSEPLYIQGGQVFLTGPYKGAPFGLSIVVPAVAGPFTLRGNAGPGREVVRAAIEINPHTAQVTVVSDPLPTILDGVPLQMKTVNVTIDRAGFMFNPTNCEALAVAGTLTSTQGASAPIANHFQAANCATLPFKPSFSVSTAGRASRTEGASLDVKIASKGGPQSGGGEANVKSVKVALPKQLPSRLTTLRKACTASTFEADPAACPHESDVGTATAVTPVLAHPLTGPAYIVSHGGEAYPDLEIVLQGEGITLILDGNTAITKGITSSTFNTVPDAPINSFELKLPTGKYSILGTALPAKAKYNLCGQALTMPTTITGQNGGVVEQTTKIAVTGCPKHKNKTTKKATAKKNKKKSGKKGKKKAGKKAHG